MSKASVIIGANYGDEGKGLMTDYLARIKGADLIIRYNGGAQAGHTVVTPEGLRHVHSHFGSGTLLGVPTYLSRYFIVNPILFKEEYQSLISKNIKPVVRCDRRCIITTPWDMMYNQYLENTREENRHGSCGVGVGATLERLDRGILPFFVMDLFIKNYVSTIDSIWRYYQDEFIGFKHNNEELYNSYLKIFNDKGIYESFLEDVKFFIEHITVEHLQFNYAIFEGAQGLCLDQHMGAFPNVTRSNTGMRNVIKLQREYGGFDIDEIVYVTRTYLTRHGAGPFEEFESVPEGISDDTNTSNSFQGSIRFGVINYTQEESLQKRINLDLESNRLNRHSQYKVKIAITHWDQLPNPILSEGAYISHGPTWRDVKYLDKEVSKLFTTK